MKTVMPNHGKSDPDTKTETITTPRVVRPLRTQSIHQNLLRITRQFLTLRQRYLMLLLITVQSAEVANGLRMF